ncbi:MAG TPA: hypothetical protein VK191_13060 [Symbiobacteriaceae bacterium]|nr:hypothetical protein [Symbiobacteriaceae bacterium]
MLKNTFRRLVGGLILFTFLLAIGVYIYKTWGNTFVWGALGWGLSLLGIIALVIWAAARADRRIRERERSER